MIGAAQAALGQLLTHGAAVEFSDGSAVFGSSEAGKSLTSSELIIKDGQELGYRTTGVDSAVSIQELKSNM